MKTKKFSKFLFIIYFLLLVWIVLFKMKFSIVDLPHYREINLHPFYDLLKFHRTRIAEMVSNILIFVPFGVFMSMFIKKGGFFKKLFPIAFTSLAFETLQYIFAIGSTDINDLITNTIGGILGILIYNIFKAIFKRKTDRIINILAGVLLIVVFSFLSALLFLQSRI